MCFGILPTFSHIDGVAGVENGLPVLDTIDADTPHRETAAADPQKEPIKKIPEAPVDCANHRFVVDADMHFA